MSRAPPGNWYQEAWSKPRKSASLDVNSAKCLWLLKLLLKETR